jgi:hypothetical protein
MSEHLDQLGTETPSSGNLLQFLAWVAAQPRSYAEAMDAWRTSCPRLSAWEDATAEGLVRVERGSALKQGHAAVLLTAKGAALLSGIRPGPN